VSISAITPWCLGVLVVAMGVESVLICVICGQSASVEDLCPLFAFCASAVQYSIFFRKLVGVGTES